MSLLLKALEKSEEEKQQAEGEAPAGQEGAQAAAPAAPAAGGGAGGGFKLSGAAGGASKLGSALGASQEARKIVVAHEEEPQEDGDAAAEALVAASRRSTVRNFVTLGVVVVAAGAGWYAWQEFGQQFLPGQEVAETDADAEQAAPAQAAADSDATLLPLSEPIFDIQESISLTSANLSGGESDGDIQGQVAEVVTNIIESQLDRQRAFIEEQQRIIAQQANLEEVAEREIEEVLSQEFDINAARQYGAFDDMVAQLERLPRQPLALKGGTQFVKPSGSDLEELLDRSASLDLPGAGSEGESDGNGNGGAASAPKQMMLAKNETDLKAVFEDAVASYRAGDLNHAEKSFRTVIAAEPRNASALVGLAKVHQSRGNVRIAVATLLKAADIAPNDPVVVSELVSLQSSSADPLVSESRILELLSRRNSQEIQARLRFLLGNSYAKQGNWDKARESYMMAHSLDQANPDIAYNLAVVFDYLNNQEGAVRMYRTAVSSAAANPSSFDLQVARDRIETLSR